MKLSPNSRVLWGFLLLALGSSMAMAGTVCPAASGTNPFPHPPDPTATGCNVVITIASNGTLSSSIKDATPYESSEDVLVGVVNNSSSTVGSLNLSGTGIFGFDGDGICIYTFVGSSYCTTSQTGGTDPGDYAGPGVTFPGWTTSSSNTGTVAFSPAIAAGGGTAYFSLEGIPAAITGTVGSTGPSTTPAPSSILLLGTGLAGLLFWVAARRRTA